MAKVEFIDFPDDDIRPQYPECPYAKIHGLHQWAHKGIGIPVIACDHKKRAHTLCVTNHHPEYPEDCPFKSKHDQCPDCLSGRLEYGSDDPVEGTYFTCQECGLLILFPLYHVLEG